MGGNKKDNSIKPSDITDLYLDLYDQIRKEYEKAGFKIIDYKPLERNKLDRFFKNFADVEMPIYDIVWRLLDVLVRLQALSNANHRTATYFVYFLLKENDIDFVDYPMNSEKWWNDFNEFVKMSRTCIREHGESRQESISRFDISCHKKIVKKWLDTHATVQSSKWRITSTVSILCSSLLTRSGKRVDSSSVVSSSSGDI